MVADEHGMRVPEGRDGLRRLIPTYLRGVVRRQTSYLLPNRDTRGYQGWIVRRTHWRRQAIREPVQPGLLSILTPVWDGSPIRYLRALANSVIEQCRDGACEWVILDNGSSRQALAAYFRSLSAYSWIKVHRIPKNIGITAGLRKCLENATGRYVLPIDADDYLYRDALKVVSSRIRRAGYPPLLFSDEDKIYDTMPCQPYMKPEWDPVLFLNSAYTAHLGVIDREKALDLGIYSDHSTEGSPDWDAFMRFVIAGSKPVHIPEILYSWRIHPRSTADDATSKPYVGESQKAVLQGFLDSRPHQGRFAIQQSPLLANAAHWHFVRERKDPKPCVSVVLLHDRTASTSEQLSSLNGFPLRRVAVELCSGFDELLPLVRETAQQDGLIQFVGGDVSVEWNDWPWEALALFELHEDAVMVGGRIRNHKGVITGAGLHFGFRGACGCPDRGRSFQDPGYFAQMWKQRSVSAVSTQFAVVRAAFLAELLPTLPRCASWAFLGAWAGAHAHRTRKRVVYSPFLSGVSDLDWETLFDAHEQAIFAEMNRDMIPDSRFYSPHLSLEKPYALCESASMTASA